MNLNKKGLVVIGVLIVIGLLSVFDRNITGEVVWEPNIIVENCNETEVGLLWDEVFKESYDSNVEIDNESSPSGGCQFTALKGDGNSIIWEIVYSGDLITLYYANVSTILYNDIMNLEGFLNRANLGLIFLARYQDIYNNSITSETDAMTFFESVYKINPASLSYDDTLIPLYFSKESVEQGLTKRITNYVIYYNKSFAYILQQEETVIDSLEAAFVNFTDNIENEVFERNSSWNNAVDLDSYFSSNVEKSYNVNFLGTNNTNGIWINATIDSNNVIKFKPTENFTGVRSFSVEARNGSIANTSNVFNVTIVKDLNDAPELIKGFGSVGVPMGGETTLYMDEYFEDPDGDNMTYRIDGAGDLKINISGNIIIIELKEAFNESIRVYIYASDGILETRSDRFWIFDSFKAAAIVVENLSDGDNLSVNISGNGSGVGNISQGSKTIDGDGLGWILWVVIGVIGVGILFFCVWFFILRKRDLGIFKKPIQSLPSQTTQAPVSDYLKNLNLPKK